MGRVTVAGRAGLSSVALDRHSSRPRRLGWTFVFLVALFFGGATNSAVAAAPYNTEPYDSCTYVPTDAFGWFFYGYCMRAGQEVVTRDGPIRLGYITMNYNILSRPVAQPHTTDGKTTWTTRYVNSDLEVGMIKCHAVSLDTPTDVGNGLIYRDMDECVDREMRSWLKARRDHIQKNAEIGGEYVPEKLENPCRTLPDKGMRAACRNPIGINACAFVPDRFTKYDASAKRNVGVPILADDGKSLQEHCRIRHKGFLAESDIAAAKPVGGAFDTEHCDSYEPAQQKSCEHERDLANQGYASTKELRAKFNRMLGIVVVFMPAFGYVGIALTCVGMAWAWYNGHPAPRQFLKLGWVFCGLVIVESAGWIAVFVT